MSADDWIMSLKAGDEVAITDAYGRGYSIAKVSRTTATQVVVPGYNGTMRRFRRNSWPREIGNNSDSRFSRLVELTDEIRSGVESLRLLQWLSGLTESQRGRELLTLPVLRAMKAAYDATKKESA